ncbi:unnamed protein product [Urochloa decumbens]|uniref:Uncharacterized protein n=1 Tax=Urochloa decumbens TaxID=240449 RepID=A0ABC8Z0Q7_9POAL
MAAAVTATTSKVGRKSLISRTLQRCKSGLSSGAGGGRASSPAGCFSVYVGPERERFVVRADCASHPLFRRLLDDAEREYGYAAQGPLALPGCDAGEFLDVLWQMENGDADDGELAGGTAAALSPICGLHSGSIKGRAAGYRMLSPRSSSSPAAVGRRR